MTRNKRNGMFPSLVMQPGPFCFAMIALALAGLCILIVRVAEEPSLYDVAFALALLCAPVLCLRPRREWS